MLMPLWFRGYVHLKNVFCLNFEAFITLQCSNCFINICTVMSDNTLSFVPTKYSMINTKLQGNFKTIVYTSHKSKTPLTAKTISEEKSATPVANTFNIKQAKQEVVKFGMSGFDRQKKEEAKVQLAIQLGAKPRRNKAKNYKQLLKEKKNAKETEKEQLNFQQLGKNKLGMSTARIKGFNRKKRKEKLNLLEPYGKVNVKQISKKKSRKLI